MQEVVRSLALVGVAVLFSLAPSKPARAWDRTFAADTSGQPGDLELEYITPAIDGGFWALGRAATVAGKSLVLALVRYDANGQIRFVRYPSTHGAPGGSPLGYPVATADGGVAFGYAVTNPFDYRYYDCYVQRFDSTGAFRWRVWNGSGDFEDPGNCTIWGSDGDSAIWVTGPLNSARQPTLVRLATDGAETTTLTGLKELRVPDPKGTDFYVAGVDSAGHTTIDAYSKQGTPLWHWVSSTSQPVTTGGFGGKIQRILVADDGNIYAFGTNLAATAGYGVSLTRTGSLRWESQLPGGANTLIESAAVATTGESYVVISSYSGTANSIQLIKLNSDGKAGWTNPFAPPGAPSGYSNSGGSVAIAGNGDVLFLYSIYNVVSPYPQTSSLLRLHPDQTQVYNVAIANGSREQQLVSLADDSTVVAGLRVGSDGTLLNPPPTSQVAGGTINLIDGVLADDGSRYFLAYDNGTSVALSHFAADGAPLWRQTHAYSDAGSDVFTPLDSRSRNRFVAGGGLVCLSLGTPLTCFSAATGQTVWTVDVPVTAMRLLADGRLVVAYGSSSGAHVAAYDAQGHVLRDTDTTHTDPAYFIRINASGEMALAWKNGITAIAADGSVLLNVASLNPLTEQSPVDLALSDDGNLLLTAIAQPSPLAASSLYSVMFDSRGSKRWQSPALVPVPTEDSWNPTTTTISANHVYVLPTFAAYDYHLSNYANVYALSLTDGRVAWKAPIPGIESDLLYTYSSLENLFADSKDQNMLLVQAYSGRTRTTQYDAATGDVVRDRFEECAPSFCIPYAAAIGSDGALRVLTDTKAATGDLELAYVDDYPFAVPAPIRLDQPGIAGAWYAPYSNGQGFTLDFIASSNTIFMPWFTFSTLAQNDDGAGLPRNELSALAWYGLQGTAAQEATSANLAIAVTNPGSFNSGGVVPRVVGSAKLQLSDCDHATLNYQFNADTNNAAGGVITLMRLTPNSSPCVLSDGSIAPAPDTNPAAQGFDAKQSGSWYNPGTSGQGIELSIAPPGNGSNGFLFATWFTFDPANQADDPIHQHWFTLQGDLANATDGKVTLPIYRIIGGSLDGAPTQNFSQVGHGTLTMLACDKAQLDYQFDSTDVAHAFAGLAGSSYLTKIGGCTTQ